MLAALRAIFAAALLSSVPYFVSAQLVIGKPLPLVELDGKLGGRVDGGAWSSAELKGKVHTIMYVDPDEKDVNEHVERALNQEQFPRDRFASVALVNTGATWKPDSAIRVVLKGKQKDYPDSVYVMDRQKTLVKRWKLADDNYHILTLDKDGRLLFEKSGRLSDKDIQELVRIIRKHL